ncbi:MAG: glycosyltransferase family 39 protein [Verrucomicrobia bacterium]|nr:glycosyltransferase family 39 protein [Verrucomicrobiota bacterium]
MAFVVLFGYLFIRTFVAPPTAHFDLDFGAARWLEPERPAPIVYFRKDIYLTATPEQAWMQIGATDSFELYVNGDIVASNEFDATNTSGIFDLKTLLHAGHNAVGVVVNRTIYPESARLIARLTIRAAREPARDVFSDNTWRAAPNIALVPPGMHWSSTEFDATQWTAAKFAVRFDPHVNQVDLDPRALATAPQGQWLASPNTNVREQGFVANFRVADARRETWLQIAATGGYELIVNGQLRALETLRMPATKASPFLRIGQSGVMPAVTSSGSVPDLSKAPSAPSPTPGAASPAPEATPSAIRAPMANPLDGDQPVVATVPSVTSIPTLQLYNITTWLQNGENEIIIRLRSPQGPAAMLADGFVVQPGGEVQRFTGDGVWRAVAQWGGMHAIRLTPAVSAGVYGQPPWGILPQAAAAPLTVPLYDSQGMAKWAIAYLAIFAAVLGLSLLCSYLVARVKATPMEENLLRDAFLHAPAFCLALFLWLISYDYRLPANFAFQAKFIVCLVCVLLAARVVHFFPLRGIISKPITLPRLGKIVLLIGIVVGGCYLRVDDLAGMSLDHDEMTLIRKAHGVLERGVPYSMIGSKERFLTTYELVSYVLAAFGFLFGWGEIAMRSPACLFGTVNIILLAWVGKRMFDWRVGWFTALIYAFLPVDIRWAQNAFYPAQAQFFSVLTFWTFYEAIRTKPFYANYLRVAAFAFCATYFSWEGTGFIVPVLAACLFTVRWGEFWWLKDGVFYRCLFWMTFIVAGQLCVRFLVNDPYLLVGIGLSTISTPSLYFLDSNYDPYYYLRKLPFSENHVFLTIAICTCAFLFWRRAAFRYLFVAIVGSITCYTNFLPVYAPRYCLFYQPLLLLLGAATVFMLWDDTNAIAQRIGGQSLFHINYACMVFFALLVFLSTNTWLLKAYRLCWEAEVPGLNIRMGSYRVDYRGASLFVKEHMRPGDVVIPGIPHVYEYYSGNTGGHFLNSLLVQQITYETLSGSSFYRDKFVGNPVIRNVNELKDVVTRAPRTWVIQAPLQFAHLNEPDVLAYFNRHGRVVFESYNAKVLLVEGAGTSAQPSDPGQAPAQ